MSLVIEFFGMPRTGKTSISKFLLSDFALKGKKVCIISDRDIEKKVKIPITFGFAYNLVFFNYVLEEYLKAKISGKYDLIILDRGFNDCAIWFDVEKELGRVSVSECKFAKGYFSHFAREINMSLMFIIKPDVSYSRYLESGEKSDSDNYVLQKDYFDKLHEMYSKINEQRNLFVFDATKDIATLQKKVLKKINSI